MHSRKALHDAVLATCLCMVLFASSSATAQTQHPPSRSDVARFAVNVPVPATDGNAQSLGGACETATTIAATSVTQVTLTGSNPDPHDFGGKNGGLGRGYGSQWYVFQATHSFVHVDTCGPTSVPQTADTLLALRYGPLCGGLVEIASSDDGCGAIGYQSELEVSGLTVGEHYYIHVAKWSTSDPDGTYTLQVTNCNGPSTVTCGAADSQEWELNPGGPSPGAFPWYWARYANNNGCDSDNPAIAGRTQITSGVTVCGTVLLQHSLNDLPFRDRDFYEFYVPAASQYYPVEIHWNVTATFAPCAWVLKAGPGANPCADYVELAYGESDLCDTTLSLTAQATEPGTYWVVVAPSLGAGEIISPAYYRATVSVDPADEPTGACCVTPFGGLPVCAISSRDGCIAPEYGSAHYWGDGTTCADVTCWECPPWASYEVESVCDLSDPFHLWGGETNGGCDHLPTPAFVDMGTLLPYFVCGTAATYLDAHPPTANLRDSDWYRYGTNQNWPAQTIKDVTATVQAEFPVEVSLATAGPDSAECAAGQWKIIATAYGRPGEIVRVSNCIQAGTSVNPLYGRVWVIVRPSFYGNPYQVPCGRNYWLMFETDTCSPGLGACCKTTATANFGCVYTIAADCFATVGAKFYGQGTACEDAAVCCPCQATNTPESESGCNSPNDADSSCFYLSWGAPPSTRRAGPITPGTQTYCGSTAWVYVSGGYVPDMDCYYFSVTTTADLFFHVYSAAMFDAFLVEEATGHGTNVCYTNPRDPDDPTAMHTWTWGLDNPACVNWTGVAKGRAPGTYHACLQHSRDDPSGAICTPTDYGPRYQVAVDVKTPGSCCIEGACAMSYLAECSAAGGTWNGNNSDCDTPNPCCTIPPWGNTEYEDNCGLPVDFVNGGCTSEPPVFTDAALLVRISGTVALDTASGLHDTDWYIYHQDAPGDIVWTVQAEFVPLIAVYHADCSNLIGVTATATANDCRSVRVIYPDAPVGDYYLLVAPDLARNGAITCGARYDAVVSRDWAPCWGDSNCDGAVNFSDIDLFVATIPDNEAGWKTLFQARYGHPPTCPFLISDCTGDGHVNFADIDPFVAAIPTVCQ